jgi:hypothetical protein
MKRYDQASDYVSANLAIKAKDQDLLQANGRNPFAQQARSKDGKDVRPPV